MTDNALCTQVWQLIGVTRSLPGILDCANGRLAFTTEQGSVFDVPLSNVKSINFPWHYFGGGVKFTIGTESYRFSFVQPNDGTEVPYHLLIKTESGDPSTLVPAGIIDGRQAGKAWKRILAGEK